MSFTQVGFKPKNPARTGSLKLTGIRRPQDPQLLLPRQSNLDRYDEVQDAAHEPWGIGLLMAFDFAEVPCVCSYFCQCVATCVSLAAVKLFSTPPFPSSTHLILTDLIL